MTKRNRANFISGLVLQPMLIGVWLLIDPWNLWTAQPVREQLGPTGAALATLSLGAAAVASLAVFWYPSVTIDDGQIVIRNPIHVVRAPAQLIEGVNADGSYPRIAIAGHVYRCMGMERSLLHQLTRAQEFGPVLAGLPSSEAIGPGVVSAQRRHLTRLELSVFAFWLSLSLASLWMS